MTKTLPLRFHVGPRTARSLAAAISFSLVAAGNAAAQQTAAAPNSVQHLSHTAYLGTGLVSSAPWLLNSTPDPAAFAVLGIGFIGVALLGRRKLAR